MGDEREPDGGGFGIAFDLDDDAPKKPAAPPANPSQSRLGVVPQGLAPPQGPPQQSFPQQGFPQQGFPQQGFPQQGFPQQGFPQQGGAQGFQGGLAPLPPRPGELPGGAIDVPPAPESKRFSEVARDAAERGKIVAEKTREMALNVAGMTRDAARNAAVQSIGGAAPQKVIRIEDPSTWLKPMRGPLIALGLAVLVSFLAVIVGKATGTKLSVSWISGLLLLGAIIFAVIRWIRLQE